MARAVSEFLAEHGNAAIRNTNALIPNEGDKFEGINEKLGESFRQLSKLIDLTMNDQSSALAHDLLAKIMVGSWLTGTAAAVAPEVKGQFDNLKTSKMRRARSGKPEELALDEAVEAERNGRPVLQPKKEAGAMLRDVNARLKAAGHAEVLIDVVRRRLEKSVRS